MTIRHSPIRELIRTFAGRLEFGIWSFSYLLVVILTVGIAAGLALPARAADRCCDCSPSGETKTTCLKINSTKLQNADNCVTLPADAKLPEGWTCKTGNLQIDTKCRTVPLGGVCSAEPASAYSVSSNAVAKSAAKSSAKPVTAIPFKLNVPIPGFTPPADMTEAFNTYIVAVFRYLISIAAIVATIMFIYGAFRYLIGSSANSVGRGQEIMTDAVIGLLLILSSTMILRTINPALTQLRPIVPDSIQTVEYKFMENEVGFKDGSAEGESEAEKAQIAGTAGIPTNTSNVSIDGIVASGSPSKQLNAYCTKSESRASLTTRDEKIAALVRTVLGFKRVCIDNKGCAYVRTGFTDLASGTVQAGVSDTPFLLKWIKSMVNLNGPVWSQDCENNYPGDKDFYNRRNVKNPPSDLIRYEYGTGNGERGSCWRQLKAIYDENLIKKMTEQGIFGGDCGTTIAAMYSCAGGQTNRKISEYVNWWGKGPGSDFIVYNATNWNELNKQIEENGPLEFGDVFVIGQKNWQHNFMYTGGRSDVPFEVFEMGGGGSNDGVVGARVTIPGLKSSSGGMRTHEPQTLSKYLSTFHGGDIFPISVARPYGKK